MRTTHIYMLLLCLCSLLGTPLLAQTTCGPEEEVNENDFSGSAFFTYGSTPRVKSNTYKSAVTVGQNFVGYTEDLKNNTTLGYWSRFLLPPFKVKVKATQGDLLDRIQVNWEIDALGPSPGGGFNIYRDGIFLEHVDPGVRSYNDFNVIAGRAYTYCISGVNVNGEGGQGCAIGFQVPNGTVTGWISSQNGAPVADATVMLDPMQGFSALFEDGDGAFALEDTLHPFLPDQGDDWTITFWIRTDTAGATPGKLIGMPGCYIRSRATAAATSGIAVATTPGGTALLAQNFSTNYKGWHHVALTFDGSSSKGRLYLDGVLRQTAAMNSVATPTELAFGERIATGLWIGHLDEVRIYHHQLDVDDFSQIMEGTASSQTPYLQHYWKMDEEKGTKSYDIVNRNPLYFCGADFDPDRPPVHTMGITNEDGYYKIESASYGTGTTFIAKPSKNFYKHYALEFDRTETDSVTIPDFAITTKATIEVWVSNAAPLAFQTILSKVVGPSGQEFRVVLDDTPDGLDNNINVHFNGTTQTYGTLGTGSAFKHLAITWDGTTNKIDVYKNGVKVNQPNNTFPALATNWSNPANPWFLGCAPTGTNFLDGWIDEFAVYDTIIPAAILAHFQAPRDPQDKGLRVYYPMDEGNGNKIHNAGSEFLTNGTTIGTEWSTQAKFQETTPHVFVPGTRQVTLNPSVTSVDQVDFVDHSTVSVTGYVRYKNTDCFAKDVEILVNGSSYAPKIFTDSTGKFIVDFDPGTSAILTPKFEEHVFVPASWEINNISTPVAGIQFNDITLRKIKGKVRGGPVDKSVTRSITGNWPPSYPNITCEVSVRSVDGCYEKKLNITDANGQYEFTDLPPLTEMTVGVSYHSVTEMLNAFQDQGGHLVDISKGDTSNIDFLYTDQPQVVVTAGLGINHPCSPTYHVFEQDDNASITIRLREDYPGGTAFVDTASLSIDNGFANDEVIDTFLSNGTFVLNFRVGDPNTTPPYLQTLQVSATTLDSNSTNSVFNGYVLGLFSKQNTFTTLLPETPSLILRDPPGDGSYSWIEKNQTVCQTFELINDFGTDLGAGLTLHLGGDQLIIIAPLGIGVGEDASSTFDIGASTNITYNRLSSTSFETCTTIDSKVATSANDLIVGGVQGGDVYMGNALNIIFGFGDELKFNQGCSLVVGSVLNVEPENFATTFIYSEYHILGVVIPYLDSLSNIPGIDPVEKARYELSIDKWEAIIENNKELKAEAEIVRNISFDAGVEYEYSQTSDTSTVESITNLAGFEAELATTVGFDFAGYGFTGELSFAASTTNGGRDEYGNANGVTVGYVLSDDDPLDAFSVDIGMDSVYRTPVFNTKIGQSSCPWEPNTAKREGVKLVALDGRTRHDVPPDEAAVFHMTLGNISATNETWTYAFTAGPESNPHGAQIFLNGAPLNTVQWYAIPWGESIPITIEVRRGPIEYDYTGLEVVLYSFCEDQRANDLGILPDTAQFLYSNKLLNVHFTKPCSEVKINLPQQGWVLKGTQTQIPIEVSGYDTSVSDFKLIRLQYRPSDGDGVWLPIGTPAVSEKYNPGWRDYNNQPNVLPPHYAQFTWTASLNVEDGPYEVRAIAICDGDSEGKNGYSEVMKGMISRNPPRLVGLPQPSDGVLHAGDEISFTFNKDIDCDKIFEDTELQQNHMGLYDAATDDFIGAVKSCAGNKLVISSNFDNSVYENHLLRAEIRNIRDLVGNNSIPYEWEFMVDRNELGWLTDSAGITKYEDETKSVSVKIHNRAGYNVPFEILNVPEWVHITPDAGTLVPNEIRELQFTAADSLAVQDFETESITLRTVPGQNPQYMGEFEYLKFGVRNICRPPAWDLDPGDFQFSMTLITRLTFNGVVSNDPEDMVAAFIDGELRGVAKLTYAPTSTNWIAFLTIYGNNEDINKLVTYEIFDASACLRHPGFFASNPFTFTPNGTQGSPTNTRMLSTNGTVVNDISLNKGWNWISFNVHFADSTINEAMDQIADPAGDLIKDQNNFSVYTNNTWAGSLGVLGNTSMYMYQAKQPNNIRMTGMPLAPASNPILLMNGWNWIAYIPTYPLTVNAALITIPAQAGDMIKSQTQFAQYVNSTVGWVGNLKKMEPLKGYQLKLTTGTLLTYPAQPFTGHDTDARRAEETLDTYWEINPSQFEHSMTFIGIFQYDDVNATTAEMELGAFAGNEIRGVAKAIYIEFLDAYMFFMTCYSNASGEQLHFKLYDAATGQIQNLSEHLAFLPNNHQGSMDAPLPFTLQITGMEDVDSELSFHVVPNPFRNETVCRIELPDAQEVRLMITDMDGKMVYNTVFNANAGMNNYVWKACSSTGSPLSSGIYFIRMETEQGVLTKKVVLQ